AGALTRDSTSKSFELFARRTFPSMTDSGVFWQAASSNIEKARKIKADFFTKNIPFPAAESGF
ncbi:MAG: hypothetical protein EGR44_03895, partial [Ruminococcaceae bacterium]|nr:hypothetical protein [Oscillospiraceae bacterium]